jgi:hypothetical protein
MGSFVVVLLEPVINDTPSFLDRCQQPAIEASIAKDPVKALVMPVLPWAARLNKVRINMLRMPPGYDPGCHELRTVVTLDVDWSATVGKQPLQDLDDLIGCN